MEKMEKGQKEIKLSSVNLGKKEKKKINKKIKNKKGMRMNMQANRHCGKKERKDNDSLTKETKKRGALDIKSGHSILEREENF